MSSHNSHAGGAEPEPLLVHTRESSVLWMHLQMPVLKPRRPLDGLWGKRTVSSVGHSPPLLIELFSSFRLSAFQQVTVFGFVGYLL